MSQISIKEVYEDLSRLKIKAINDASNNASKAAIKNKYGKIIKFFIDEYGTKMTANRSISKTNYNATLQKAIHAANALKPNVIDRIKNANSVANSPLPTPEQNALVPTVQDGNAPLATNSSRTLKKKRQGAVSETTTETDKKFAVYRANLLDVIKELDEAPNQLKLYHELLHEVQDNIDNPKPNSGFFQRWVSNSKALRYTLNSFKAKRFNENTQKWVNTTPKREVLIKKIKELTTESKIPELHAKTVKNLGKILTAINKPEYASLSWWDKRSVNKYAENLQERLRVAKELQSAYVPKMESYMKARLNEEKAEKEKTQSAEKAQEGEAQRIKNADKAKIEEAQRIKNKEENARRRDSIVSNTDPRATFVEMQELQSNPIFKTKNAHTNGEHVNATSKPNRPIMPATIPVSTPRTNLSSNTAVSAGGRRKHRTRHTHRKRSTHITRHKRSKRAKRSTRRH
jgi:hypothetical protein